MSASRTPSPIEQCILPEAKWQEMYPREEYLRKGNRARELSLHFLLALNQSDRLILASIENWKTKNPTLLRAADPKNAKITPLILSTMKRRTVIAERLYSILSVAELNAADSHGWRALHHAAISSNEIYTGLLRKGADVKATTEMNGTAENLISLTSRRIIQQNVTFVGADGRRAPLTEKEMGIELYCDLPFYPAHTQRALWEQVPDESNFDPELNPIRQKMYREYQESPPALTAGSCRELTGITSRALELLADEHISAGKVIGTYGGTVRTEKPKIYSLKDYFDPSLDSELYVLDEVDASASGNAIRLSNWGWPNSVMMSVVDQGTRIPLLIAIEQEGIQLKEPILWDYGIGEFAIAFGPFVLLGREKMREFFSAGLEAQLNNYQIAHEKILVQHASGGIITEDLSRVHCLNTRILYPLNTPAALLDLHFKGIVSAREWLSQLLFNNNDLIGEWMNEYQFTLQAVRSLIMRIIELEAVIHPAYRDVISRWVLDHIGKLSVMQILKGMDIIKEGLVSRKPMTEIFGQLSDQLPGYDWREDEQAPLGFNRSVEDLLQISQLQPKEVAIKQVQTDLESMRQEGTGREKESFRKAEALLERLLAAQD